VPVFHVPYSLDSGPGSAAVSENLTHPFFLSFFLSLSISFFRRAGGVWLGADAEESRFRGNNVIASNTVRLFFFITLKSPDPGASKLLSNPLSNELGTRKTVKATFWPWLELFSVGKSSDPYKLLPLRSVAANHRCFFVCTVQFCVNSLRCAWTEL
jgi:hypothetical protein